MKLQEGRSMELKWDVGTAYELFSSLYVIHDASYFGVRASWAAGVRSRIPAESRELFSNTLDFFKIPICWIYGLPGPKSGASAIEKLEEIGPGGILADVIFAEKDKEKEKDSPYAKIIGAQKWDDSDLEDVVDLMKKHGKNRPDRKKLAVWLDWLTKYEEFGRLFIDGVTEYYENFFREEEKRIGPALSAGLARAKELSKTLDHLELLEELSQGIKSEPLLEHDELVLIPSFWLSPFVMLGEISEQTGFMQFGARPHDASLIPGDSVPDSLSVGLQALSDHTRLKVLKLVSKSPMSQTEIAKALRLRTPTISHHMKTLRMAGLVTRTIDDDDPNNTRFSARDGRIDELCESIKEFLSRED